MNTEPTTPTELEYLFQVNQMQSCALSQMLECRESELRVLREQIKTAKNIDHLRLAQICASEYANAKFANIAETARLKILAYSKQVKDCILENDPTE